MMLKISIVVGNPKPNSRTLKVASRLVEDLVGVAEHELVVIDLATYTSEVLAWPSETMKGINDEVAASDLVVFASPTYKATYTGLLKAFLDRYGADGLAGVTAIPVMTGADLGHSMGPDVNLAPLLMELGAIVPGRGFYFITEQMDRLDEIVAGAAARYRSNFQKLEGISSALPEAASQPVDSSETEG